MRGLSEYLILTVISYLLLRYYWTHCKLFNIQWKSFILNKLTTIMILVWTFKTVEYCDYYNWYWHICQPFRVSDRFILQQSFKNSLKLLKNKVCFIIQHLELLKKNSAEIFKRIDSSKNLNWSSNAIGMDNSRIFLT